VIGGIVDTGDKFITGVVETAAAQSSPVTMTPPVSTTLVNNDRWLQRHL
jgi:hypothetical protein